MLFWLALGAVILGGHDGGHARTTTHSLAGTPWQLTSGIHVKGWKSVAPSAHFKNGRMSGFDGCNSFGASYARHGGALRIRRHTTTLIHCGEPAWSVSLAYHHALDHVRHWRIDGGELVLADRNGGKRLRYRESTVVGSWSAFGVPKAGGLSSPIEGTRITATFRQDGTLSGASGCNHYSAIYRAHHGSISITDLAVTDMSCSAPAGVLEQEREYLAALPKTTYYDVDPRGLQLLSAKRRLLANYEPAP